MIDFIYVVILAVYAMVFMAVYVKEYTLGLLSGIAILVVGVYLAIYGAGDVNNFLTQAFGTINIALGAYLILQGNLEFYQEVV